MTESRLEIFLKITTNSGSNSGSAMTSELSVEEGVEGREAAMMPAAGLLAPTN